MALDKPLHLYISVYIYFYLIASVCLYMYVCVCVPMYACALKVTGHPKVSSSTMAHLIFNYLVIY